MLLQVIQSWGQNKHTEAALWDGREEGGGDGGGIYFSITYAKIKKVVVKNGDRFKT